jgi:CBS domain
MEPTPPAKSANPVALLGHFHRVSSILPDTPPVTVPSGTKVATALDLMDVYRFSQLPVQAGEAVLGLFSHRSFTQTLARSTVLRKRAAAFDTLVVDDFLEDPVYVGLSDDLATVLRFLDDDATVLVGDRDRLLAVATASDAIRYLDQVTGPFVLIEEIEQALRGLIKAALTPRQIADGAVGALSNLYGSQVRSGSLPTQLSEMTFDEQVTLVLARGNWPLLAETLGPDRTIAGLHLRPIGAIRNTVFHFRRELDKEERDQLATTRNWMLLKVRRHAGTHAVVDGIGTS